MHDFAVQNCGAASEFLGDRCGQRLECLKRIPVARYQSAGAALDISDSSKTVHLRLKDPVGMLEGHIEACQRRRGDAGEADVSVF